MAYTATILIPLKYLSLPAIARTVTIVLVVAASALASDYSVFNQHPDDARTADGAWKVHDMTRPWPPSATPKPWVELEQGTKTPSGARILFDGSNPDAWELPQPWSIHQGVLQVRPVNTSLSSKDSFGSCHLHLEWRTTEYAPAVSMKSHFLSMKV